MLAMFPVSDAFSRKGTHSNYYAQGTRNYFQKYPLNFHELYWLLRLVNLNLKTSYKPHQILFGHTQKTQLNNVPE